MNGFQVNWVLQQSELCVDLDCLGRKTLIKRNSYEDGNFFEFTFKPENATY